LASRGLSAPSIQPKIDQFLLGYVGDPLPGHESYRGKLAIPYLRWSKQYGWAVVSIRFRRLTGEGAKYLTVANDRPRLYNTLALLQQSKDIAITEGEFDAITASLCGLPAVGVPGTQAWQPHFREPFLGYRNVFVLSDGDEAGLGFGRSIVKQLPNAKLIPMPDGEDVNSLVVNHGQAALMERIG
jgi:DNA primase